MEESIRKLNVELSSPGIDKLYIAARRRGLEVTKQQIKDALPKRADVEGFRLPQRFLGKSAAEAPDARWQADLAEMPIRKGFKGFLMVIDVFTREAFAGAIKNKTAANVARVFKGILAKAGQKPGMVSTDGGPEFAGEFRRLLAEENITWRTKRVEAKNDIAIVDRAMATLKLDLRKRVLVRQGQWPDLLQKVIRGYNTRPHAALHDAAPSEVTREPTVHFMLLQDNARNLKHNDDLETKRGMAVAKAGAYRPPTQQAKLGNRIGNRRYEAPRKLEACARGSCTTARAGRLS